MRHELHPGVDDCAHTLHMRDCVNVEEKGLCSFVPTKLHVIVPS